MNLSEMRNSLRRKIGNPSVTDVSDSDLNQYLNESQRYILDTYPFHMGRSLATFPTVAGTNRYQLPSDLTVLMKVGNRTTQARLTRRDALFQTRTEAQTTTSPGRGEPLFYTRMLNWIQFYPIPDAVYTISLFYKNSVADLTEDGDTTVLPLPWHDGMVRYARYVFYDEKQDFAKAQYCYASWTLWVGRKADELQDELVYESEDVVEMPFLRGGNLDETSSSRLDFERSD